MSSEYLREAMDLAGQARGQTSPNPLVGAVLVRDGEVVGRGSHTWAGVKHAEIQALDQAGDRARGASLYINLEPCSHQGRTAPCADALIAAGVTRVVAAMEDPNPRVAGEGFRRLRDAGVAVEVAQDFTVEAEKLNEDFVCYMRTHLPLVTLKTALTLDGKIAAPDDNTGWITSERARAHVQELRHDHDAILTGIGTVLADNPSLTARTGSAPGRAPLRIVLDPSLRIPLRAKVVTDRRAPTLVVTTSAGAAAKRAALQKAGAEVLVLPSQRGRIQWRALLSDLGRRGIASLLIEGGAELNASALREKAVDRVLFFLAPRLLGGRGALGAIGGLSPARLREALPLKEVAVMRIGSDILVQGSLK